MKRWIRYISFFLTAVMLLSVPAYAAENATPRASHYIMSTCVYLDKTTSYQFNVWYEVIALGIMDEVGAYLIKVQESTDGQNWTTVKTYTPADEPSMVATNAPGHAGHVTYTGLSGRFYRAYIILYAKNSSGRGDVSDYTDTLYLPYNMSSGRQS